MRDDKNQSYGETYQPCERRFRTSKYFLADQLRCSEAAEDLRSVKQLLSSTPAFNIRTAFQFQTVKVKTD